MLSEEEKKAIKYFYNLRSTIDESYMLFDEEINVKCGKETIKQITLVLNLIIKLQKENEELKYHIHYKICKNCGEEYKSKRNDSKYCSKCARTVNNKNWYKNLTEKQKAKRREQAKFYMRKIRKEKKQND